LGYKGERTIGEIDRYGTRPDALSLPIEKPVTQVSSRCGSRPMSCGPHMSETLKGGSRPAWSKRQTRDFIMHAREGDAMRTG